MNGWSVFVELSIEWILIVLFEVLFFLAAVNKSSFVASFQIKTSIYTSSTP